MSWSKQTVFCALLTTALSAGCPLEDSLDTGNDLGNADEADAGRPINESPNQGGGPRPSRADAGMGGEEDAAAQMADGGTSTEDDASAQMPDGSTGEEDAGMDSGTGETDSGSEEDAGPDGPPLGDADTTDEDRVAMLVQYLEDENYEDTWLPFFQKDTSQRDLVVDPTRAHRNQVRVFQNDISQAAADAWLKAGMPKPLVMPNGSIVVKDGYKYDEETMTYSRDNVLIMVKIDALDPETYKGNWFYFRIKSDGKASTSTSCVKCHDGQTQKTIWPPDPEIMDDPGGNPGAIVPYDYLYLPFCVDPINPECSGPDAPKPMPDPIE